MRFEVANSLRELDRVTPLFFRREALAMGDQTMKREAIRILKSLGDSNGVTVLKEILRIV